MLRRDNEDEGQEVLFSSRNSLTNCVTKVAEIVGHKGEKFMNLTEQRLCLLQLGGVELDNAHVCRDHFVKGDFLFM